MAEQTKHNINIKIADLTPIPLQIKLEDEKTYRDAEALVNGLWLKWMQTFKDKCTSKVEEFLTSFEKELDELVINITADSK